MPIREQIADAISGGQLTEARNSVDTLQQQHREVLAETRKLSREVENLKEGGGMLAEGYADCTWNNRIALDQQWQVLSGSHQLRIIQKSEVDIYHDLLNYAYQFCPLIKGAIDIKTRYTFGLQFSIESEIESNKKTIKVIQEDLKNQFTFFSSQAIAEADHDLQKAGNLYIAIWWKLNPIQIRFWSSYEIADVIMDPQDSIPMFYIRSLGNGKTKAYPSIFNTKYAGIVNQEGVSAIIDNDILVYHLAEGKDLKQKWALSPYTAALRWNRFYEGFLIDFATIVQLIRKYAAMFTTSGGDAQVNALKDQFDHEQHGHHKGQIADTLITTEGNDFKVIDAGNSKIVGLSDSRPYLLQVCTVSGVPENMLTGNPQTGNRASAEELATNFLPVIEERQTAWAGAFKMIFTRILGNTDFDISFPPIRSQDAITYLQGLTSIAMNPTTGTLTGVIQPVDVIRAVYESLDLKLPADTDIDDMAAFLLDKMNQSPGLAAAIERLTEAATKLQGAEA